MSKEPNQLAHQRLVALAQERRRVAEKLPPLSGPARQRLLTEVERLQGETLRLSEDPAGAGAKGTSPWSPWLSWLGVAAAAAVLFLVVRLAETEPKLDPAQARSVNETAAVEAAESGIAPTAGGAVANPVADEVRTFAAAAPLAENDAAAVAPAPGAAATDLLRPGESAASSLASTAADATVASAREGGLLAAAQRIRRRYQAVTSQGSPPPFLGNFEVTQRGHLVNLRESDGSSYTGRVTRLPRRAGQTGPVEWSFEGKGLQQARRETVWIVGNFLDRSGASGAVAAPQVLEATLTATIQVDGTNLFELRATPSDP